MSAWAGRKGTTYGPCVPAQPLKQRDQAPGVCSWRTSWRIPVFAIRGLLLPTAGVSGAGVWILCTCVVCNKNAAQPGLVSATVHAEHDNASLCNNVLKRKSGHGHEHLVCTASPFLDMSVSNMSRETRTISLLLLVQCLSPNGTLGFAI